jgi:MerR family Zn(II)-responsive transcriptional regulator of zntA
MIAHEIAELAQVKASVVRYYTRIGLLNPSRNPENRYHQYTPRDVKRVRFIRKAKWLGFTLKDVKTILDEADSGKSPCRKVRRIIGDRIVENQQRLKHLQQTQARMESAMAAWALLSDSAPGNESICGLIDNVDFNEKKA